MSSGDLAQTRRALRTLLLLAGKETIGLRLSEVAKALDELPSTAARTLSALETEGFVERMPEADERWRLGPKLVQIAQAHVRGLSEAEQRIREVAQRYSRTP